MFANYITTGLRHIFRHKLYSVINIGGLAVGLAACILILLFVRDEFSYDRWLPGAENIYRMHSTFTLPGRPVFRTVRSSGRIFYSIPDNVPEAEEVTRIYQAGGILRKDGEVFSETVSLVDPNFFEIFDLPFAAGDATTALPDLSSTVISESMAQKYFGTNDPRGETLTVCCQSGEPIELKVTGVIRDIPENSHFDHDILALIDRESFKSSPWIMESWTSVNAYTYFTLVPGATVDELEASVTRLLEANVDPAHAGVEGNLADLYNVSFMPVSDIHLRARDQAADMGDMRPLGDLETLYGLIFIAGLVLVIASINFMNLATSRATQRAREVSLRKVLGAERKQLVVQFIGESVIVTLAGFVLALALVELVLPFYNQFLQRELALQFTSEPSIVAGLLAAALLLGVASGVYPALVLSGFRPARILKANQSADPEGRGRLRLALVVIQFAISIGLVVAAAVIYSQISLARESHPGYERDNRLIIRGLGRSNVREAQDAMAEEIRRLPGVEAAVLSSDVPTDNFENNNDVTILGRQDLGRRILNIVAVDYGFMETYGVAPLAGRLLSEKFGADSLEPPEDEGEIATGAVVLNAFAVRHLGFENPEEALGEVVASGLSEAGSTQLTIVGVIPDIRFRSLKFGVQPTMYFRSKGRLRTLTVAYRDGAEVGRLVGEIEAVWKRHAPGAPFRYEFLSEILRQQYADEDQQFALFAAFSGLAILVACLGLFGLASFSAERRTKEIGLRKVLGATVPDIIRLLVWQFSKPVLVANLIAWPVAGYFMIDWLRGFELRLGTDDLLALFAAAGAAALLVAWATVGAHAARVARSNPAEALRYE